MATFLNLFTPETWGAFREDGARLSGFTKRQEKTARERVGPGDILLCYMTRLSRWCGALEVASEAFEDATPIFGDPDPYLIRFKVRPLVLLDPEHAIPIFEPEVWGALSMTRDQPRGSSRWTGHFRASLKQMEEPDGRVLLSILQDQAASGRSFLLTDRDRRQLARGLTVRTLGGAVQVSVPEDEDADAPTETSPAGPHDTRDSIRMQAQVAQIGAAMGFRIWIPSGDRARVRDCLPQAFHQSLLEDLPLNYDETTLRTIRNIDVIWLRRRAMARAFEIEHTTATYSGLLRMADLLALQPNMDIRLHIVAPAERRDKVFEEIRRPVFTLLERGPLYRSCTFLDYNAVEDLAANPHLAHLSDSILKEYEEHAHDA